MSTLARIIAKTVYQADGCLVVASGLQGKGYGQISVEGRKQLTHRVAYELLVGPIPDGLQLDHLCRNRACWRPDHLEPVTNRVNTLRGDKVTARSAQVTHDPYGHPYSGDNLIISSQGRRVCRICVLESRRKYYAKKKAAREAEREASHAH